MEKKFFEYDFLEWIFFGNIFFLVKNFREDFFGVKNFREDFFGVRNFDHKRIEQKKMRFEPSEVSEPKKKILPGSLEPLTFGPVNEDHCLPTDLLRYIFTKNILV